MDPCTPKGYSHVVESWKLSPGSLTEKNRSLSTLHSRGNFSECRSAALTLLQKGKGMKFCQWNYSVTFCVFCSFSCFIIWMQRYAPISIAKQDHCLYLSFRGSSWPRKISFIHQRLQPPLPFLMLHYNFFSCFAFYIGETTMKVFL